MTLRRVLASRIRSHPATVIASRPDVCWAGPSWWLGAGPNGRWFRNRARCLEARRLALRRGAGLRFVLPVRLDLIGQLRGWSSDLAGFDPAWIARVPASAMADGLRPWLQAGYQLLHAPDPRVTLDPDFYAWAWREGSRGGEVPCWYFQHVNADRTLRPRAVVVRTDAPGFRAWALSRIRAALDLWQADGLHVGVKQAYYEGTGWLLPDGVRHRLPDGTVTLGRPDTGPIILSESPFPPGAYMQGTADAVRELAAESLYVSVQTVESRGLADRWAGYPADVRALLLGEWKWADV